MPRATFIAPLLWTAFLVWPRDGWGVLDGAPLGLVEASALGLIWWDWAATRTLRAGWPLATCLVLKIAAGSVLLPHGFSASYFANGDFAPPLERSVEYRGGDVTRVDRRLAFGRPGLPDLPLFFFDDIGRFNFYQRGQPRRSELPFSVVWDGYVPVEEGERARTFYLKGTAAAASLAIDGASVLALDHGGGSATTVVLYPKGWRHIVVRVSGREGAARDFEAGFVDPVDGTDRPLGTEPVFRAPSTRLAVQLDAAVRISSGVIDSALLAALAWFSVGAARRRTWVALGTLVAFADAMRFALPMAGKLVLQPGGDDSLTYSTYARDIILNGPLMLMGSAPGEGAPFYYQPLYSYLLALVHLTFGDDLFGLYLVQRCSLFLVLWAVCRIGGRLFGAGAARAGVLVGGLFLYVLMDPWAETLWTEVLFVPLVAAWACLLLAMADAGANHRTAALTGLVGGLAVLCRSTLLLALVPVLILFLHAGRRTAGGAGALAVMLTSMALVISLATARNWIVSGQFVPITTSFGINLYLGNTPTTGVPIHPVGEHGLDRWMAGDDRTRPVLEFVRHDPAAFISNLWRKTRYALGVFEPLVAGAGYSVPLMMTWVLAVVGFALAMCRPVMWRPASAGPTTAQTPSSRATVALPMAISASMFAAVILIFPTHPRLILPAYVMLLPHVAFAVARAAQRVLLTMPHTEPQKHETTEASGPNKDSSVFQ